MNTKCLIIGAALAGVAAQAASAQCCAPKKTLAQETSRYAQADIEAVKLQVEGMTCGQCAASINTALKKIDGVRKIDISFEQKGGTVEYDPAKVDEKIILETVNKAGFKAQRVVIAKG